LAQQFTVNCHIVACGKQVHPAALLPQPDEEVPGPFNCLACCFPTPQGAVAPTTKRTGGKLDFSAFGTPELWSALITFLYLDFMDATSTVSTTQYSTVQSSTVHYKSVTRLVRVGVGVPYSLTPFTPACLYRHGLSHMLAASHIHCRCSPCLALCLRRSPAL
jgi:hypothetical protein